MKILINFVVILTCVVGSRRSLEKRHANKHDHHENSQHAVVLDLRAGQSKLGDLWGLLTLMFRVLSDSEFLKVTAFQDHDLEGLVVDLLNILISNHDLNCFTVICDNIYLNIFDGELFKRIIATPYMIVVVEEYEDLLSPNFDTLQAIRQARRDGCGAYIILLANGMQTSRLLKFGDRYRIIDTRAKFILLHDFRLFISEMHYIWKRIVNVIFIRHHGRYGDMSRKFNSWYDLSTVPFPTPIKGILLPRRLDTWKNGKFYKNNPMFPDKTKDLRGQTLNVVYLQHIPAVIKKNTSHVRELGGLEVEILKTLSKAINFHPRLYEPTSVEVHQWGQKQINGSFSGLLGEMVNGKADIALGNLHYTPYHLQLTDLTIPYISQCLTFLTPESLTDNSWKTLLLPFRLNMWIAVLTVLFVTGLIFYVLANYHIHLEENYITVPTRIKRNETHEEDKKLLEKFHLPVKGNRKQPTGLYLFGELVNSILYTYGMLLVVSLPNLPKGWSIRLLTGWYWLYCILLVVSYRASMTAILANPAPRITIDTLNELVDSKITCGGWGSETKRFFLTSLDETSQKIGDKFETINEADEAVQRVARGEFAYYENQYFLNYISVKRQTSLKNSVPKQNDSDSIEMIANVTEDKFANDRNLHIMSDCVVNMPISIGLQKNSPLKPLADKYLRRIIEVGLVEKWLNDVMLPLRTTERSKEEEIKALMNLKKLYAAFIALAIGYSLSALCFIGENLKWYFIEQKHPDFDKYALDIYYAKKKLAFQKKV